MILICEARPPAAVSRSAIARSAGWASSHRRSQRLHNSTNIASRIRGAELYGYEGGHVFLFQDPAAFPAFIAFLQAPSS